MEVRVGVPLRDFYKGMTTEFQLEKQHICEECEGSGSADGAVDTCSSCGGHGIKIQKHMLAPGIFQQVQVHCDVCSGKGKTIKNPCPVCAGSRVVRKISTHQLVVERGAKKGEKMVYENEADASPDWVAGDLHVTLTEKPPSLEEDNEGRVDGTFFRRRGDDMFWREVLSLREAWMGAWTRNITHLDGHVVRLSRKRGEVVQPGLMERVKGEGMPVWREDGGRGMEEHAFGDLFVEYTVVLPDQMDKAFEKEMWAVWEKWMKKKGVDLEKDSAKPRSHIHGLKDEL